jgi:hypothetical protein
MGLSHRYIFAVVCVAAVSACSANPQNSSSVRPTRNVSHVDRLPAEFAHGAEIERGTTFMVSEGNYHAAFPAGATYKRTANGIVVTFNGVTRTFSSAARVDIGTYHRYAKAAE